MIPTFHGVVFDDSSHSFDSQNSYAYWACPETVKKIEKAMLATEKNPPYYNYVNVLFFNCAGQACAWIEAGGLTAPYWPHMGILKPAGKGTKDYGFFRKPEIERNVPEKSIIGTEYNPLNCEK